MIEYGEGCWVVGGYGLLCGVELVMDRKSNLRFPKEANVPDRLGSILMRHGLMTRVSDVIPLVPPLVISKSEVDHVVDTLDTCLTELQREI